MNRNFLHLIVATTILGFWNHQVVASDVSGNHYSSSYKHKTFQTYVGISGGIEKLTGTHSDALIEPQAIPPKTYASNQALPSSGKGLVGSGMGGVLINIPSVPISIGPEVYIGRSDATSNFRFAYTDLAAGEDRVYSSILKRTSFYGVLLRGGVNFCKEYFAYVSIGADFSNFSITRSLQKDTAIPDTHTSIVKVNKNIRGLLYGIGLEKQFQGLKVGVDLKGIRFGKTNLSDLIPTTNGIGGGLTYLNYSSQPKIYAFTLRVSYLL